MIFDFGDLIISTISIVIGSLGAYWLSHQGRT